MHKLPQPVKVRYWGPFFRYEAPQAGRYRQFTQVGIEAIGSDDPSLDAEVILLLAELLRRAHVPSPRLRLSTLGTPEARRAYSDRLRTYLREHESRLSDDVRARLDRNPLRAFDSDHEGTRELMADAPRLIEHLDEADLDHFAEVRQLLDDEGLDYEVDATLVRGLDYYTRTVFEFSSDALGAQSQLGGGGRYDGLIEQLGGQPTPGVGFAAGVERILLASQLEPDPDAPHVYVAHAGERREAFRVARELRAAGVTAAMEQAGRSMKGQLKHANRLGVAWVLILTDGGMLLKNMETGEQRPIESLEEVPA
jgi:histidyl-tRNA synthetase